MGQRGEYMRSRGTEYWVGKFIQHHETGQALLLGLEGQTRDEAEWVPLSQIKTIDRSKTSPVIVVTMTAWIAKEKRFID